MSHGAQNADGHGQIEAGAFLAHVGRRQVDGERPCWGSRNPEFMSADLMRSRLSRTAISGMPTVTESRAIAGGVHVDFDVDQMRIDAVHGRAAGFE